MFIQQEKQRKSDKNLLQEALLVTWIGKNIEVLNSRCNPYYGVSGKVVSETKHFFRIRREDGQNVMILKKVCEFKIQIGGKYLKVSGDLLHVDLIERIKKGIKK